MPGNPTPHRVAKSVKGMASVVALMSFIGAWDDFLWPLVVLNEPEKYTLTVGMQYLQSSFGTDQRRCSWNNGALIT